MKRRRRNWPMTYTGSSRRSLRGYLQKKYDDIRLFDDFHTLMLCPSEAGFVQEELWMTSGNPGTPASTGSALCVPTLGSGENQRIGSHVKLCEIHGHVYLRRNVILIAPDLTNPDALSGAPFYCKMVIVLDTQHNGSSTAPTFTDVYDNATAGAEFNWFRRLDTRRRYKILMEKTFKIGVPRPMSVAAANHYIADPTSATGVESASFHGLWDKVFEIHKKVNIPLDFTASTGGNADLSSNAVFVGLRFLNPTRMKWNGSGNASDVFAYDCVFRTRFYDA